MANLVKDIEKLANGKKILGCVIGEMGWSGGYNKEGVPNYDKQPQGKLLTWKVAKRWLNYDFDDGYGAPSCNAVYAWTENSVIAVGQYDGATWLYELPRDPVNCMPSMEGG